MKVMIVVTHLLGTGHLARALTLARAYLTAGDEVLVVSGGMPTPLLTRGDVPLDQLPPLRSDGVDFTRLRDAKGMEADAPYLAERREALLASLSRFGPNVLITELFPFGRRILSEEFTALLETANNTPSPPLICASIRDILAPPSKPSKAAYADEVVTRYYDAVLVHSDPALTPLELSWPVSDALRPLLHYTGFVAPPLAPPHPEGAGAGEVLVSAGGGDVGSHVYEAALAAAPLLSQRLRLLVGGANAEASVADLRTRAPANVQVERARPDFRQMLHHAAASVSLCGYNTSLDILQAGTPAVFIPFDEGSEVEQGLRAQALAAQTGIVLLPRADLSARRLCQTLEEVIAAPRRDVATTGFDGAARTVAITRALRSAR